MYVSLSFFRPTSWEKRKSVRYNNEEMERAGGRGNERTIATFERAFPRTVRFQPWVLRDNALTFPPT